MKKTVNYSSIIKKAPTLVKANFKNITFYRRLAIAILLLLILIRPTISTENSNRNTTNLNIWFVVDATGSMVARDVDNGNKRRFEAVREDMTAIIKNSPGAKYGTIVQDYSSYVASPMSTNADAAITSESFVSPKDSTMSKPSNLTELLNYSSEKITKYKERYPDRANVLIFMSDGEDVSSSELTIPNNLSETLSGAIVFGYGTTEGSLIEEIGIISESGDFNYTGIDENQYVSYYGNDNQVTTDSEYRVISKINEENLQKIASSLNGKYYHRESGNVPQEVFETMSNASSTQADPSSSQASTGAEIYWIFAILLLILLAWEGEEILLHILTEKEAQNA